MMQKQSVVILFLFSQIGALKQDYQIQIEKLNNEHKQRIEELQAELDKEKLTLNEKYQEISTYKIKLEEQENLNNLEVKLNNTLSEKANLESELDRIHLQIQTIKSNLNESNSKLQQAEQNINQLEVSHILLLLFVEIF